MNILRRLGAAVAALLVQRTEAPQRKPTIAAAAHEKRRSPPHVKLLKVLKIRRWRVAPGLGCPGDRSGRLGRLHMQSMRRAGLLKPA